MSVQSAPTLWRDDMLSERFERLTSALEAGEFFWRHHAFQSPRLPWENAYAILARRLRELSLDEAERFATDTSAVLTFLAPYAPAFADIEAACAVGSFAAAPLPDVEVCDTPGRKWQQIRHFAPCVPVNEFAVLEWCAGKAHLGRTLARSRRCAVMALDRDAALIADGERLAARERIAVDFRRVDVMQNAAATLLQRHQNAVALHACGDLHLRLLRGCVDARAATLTLAPCCYHLVEDEAHYCLSNAARTSGVRLHRNDLRTAVHGTVTAPARQTRQRRRLQAWRLGFDLLQREVRGSDDYLPTPSLSIAVLKQGFDNFCRTLAAKKNLALPAATEFAVYERAGHERLREVTALDLPRTAFRRALELWLALDRALFLREHGYRVELGEFCAAALTPRNLLVRARINDSSLEQC